MSMSFTVPGTMPSLNEFYRAERHEQARMKKMAQEDIMWCAKAAHVEPIHGEFSMTCRFFEPNRRRDLDNISAVARKFILDALQELGAIDNDLLCTAILDEKLLDRDNPRIEVEISERRAR